MVSEKAIIKNSKGLHLKPAGFLCHVALEYHSVILLKIREKQVNAKSVLGVLSACIKQGEMVTIECNGEDEEQALRAMIKAIANGLGEKEDA